MPEEPTIQEVNELLSFLRDFLLTFGFRDKNNNFFFSGYIEESSFTIHYDCKC